MIKTLIRITLLIIIIIAFLCFYDFDSMESFSVHIKEKSSENEVEKKKELLSYLQKKNLDNSSKLSDLYD
tara:strand:- start:5858 stop:6067 length:210 start_codon:yes stop_codon:yes gene_type:complete